MEKAVLFVIPTLETGGAQTFLVRLATHFGKEARVYVYVIHPGSADTANEEKLAAAGIGVIHRRPSAILLRWLENRSWKKLRRLLSRIDSRTGMFTAWDRRHLKRLIRSKGIAIVNSHMYLADSYCCRILEKYPIPIVTTLHGCYNLIVEEIARGKWDSSYVAEFTADTAYIADRLNGIVYLTDRQLSAVPALRDAPVPKKKIYNGFMAADPANFKPAAGAKTHWHFGMVARGIAPKGWEQLLLAYLQIKEKNPDKTICLSLVGDGEFLQDLKEKYSDPSIVFHGRIANPLSLMQDWDVGMLPTWFDAESLPNSVIEYLFSGLAVIATGIAEIPNMIAAGSDRAAGFLIPLTRTADGVERPQPDAIADAMQRYIDDATLWQTHRHNASLAYAPFDIRACVESYRSFFGQVKSPNPL